MVGLKGKTIITTCGNAKADKLNSLLSAKGAKAINFPLISIQPNTNNKSLIKQKLTNLGRYHWIVFTSTNGVQYFTYWLKEFNIDVHSFDLKYAAIGSATSQLLSSLGYNVNYVSESRDSVEFANELMGKVLSPGQRILVPTSNLASSNLKNLLNSAQSCEYLIVYNTVENITHRTELIQIITNGNYNLIVFLSPSAVNSFTNQVSTIDFKKVNAAVIGKTTYKALKEKGIEAKVVARIPSIEELINEIDKLI